MNLLHGKCITKIKCLESNSETSSSMSYERGFQFDLYSWIEDCDPKISSHKLT
jgi:hypothetical protein